MYRKLAPTLKIITSTAYFLGILFLVTGLILGAVNQPVSAQGPGDCGSGYLAKIESSGSTVSYSNPDDTLTSVIVRAASVDKEEGGCYPLTQNGSNGCYSVSGLDTDSATVSKVGSGSDCISISHVEFYGKPNPPTKTPVTPPPPTETFTPTFTNTPELPPEVTPTFTNTPETPTSTNTPETPPEVTPTFTNTPENPPEVTPTFTNTPENPPEETPTFTNTPEATATSTLTPEVPPGITPTFTNTPFPATITNVPPTATNTPQPPPGATPTATTVPTLPPPATPATSVTPGLIPVTGADSMINLSGGMLRNLGFILLGLGFVFNGLYLKLSKS